MRPIKFRGRNIDTGEFVYGYLIQHFINSRVAKAIIYWNLVMHEVEPESVAQLVGYDADGNEVYEGDMVFNPGIMGYQDAQLINNYDDEYITLKEDDQ